MRTVSANRGSSQAWTGARRAPLALVLAVLGLALCLVGCSGSAGSSTVGETANYAEPATTDASSAPHLTGLETVRRFERAWLASDTDALRSVAPGVNLGQLGQNPRTGMRFTETDPGTCNLSPLGQATCEIVLTDPSSHSFATLYEIELIATSSGPHITAVLGGGDAG